METRDIPKDALEIMPGLLEFRSPDDICCLIWNWRSITEESIDLEVQNEILRKQGKDLVLETVEDYFLKVIAPTLGGTNSPLWKQEYENDVSAATRKLSAFHAFDFYHHTKFYKHKIPGAPLYITIDFGLYHPCAVFIQSESDGSNTFYHVHDVIRGNTEGTSLKSFLNHLREVIKTEYTESEDKTYWYTVQEGDTPSGTGITSDRGARTPVEQMWELAIYPKPRKYSKLQDRVDLVNEVLNRSIKSKPVLSFNPNCKDLIEMLEGGYRRETIVRFGQTMPTATFFKDGWYDHVADAFGGGFIVCIFGKDSPNSNRLKSRKGLPIRVM